MTFPPIFTTCLATILILCGLFFMAGIGYRVKIRRRQCPRLSESMDRFSIHSRDGISLAGLSSGTHPKDHQAVILAHGFGDNKTNCEILKLALALQDAFDVYLFDFRGYGESGGKSTMGVLEDLDLQAAIDYVTGLGYNEINLIGNSIGGMVAIRIASQTNQINALVSVSASTGLENETFLRRNLFKFVFTTTPGRLILKILSGISIARDTSRIFTDRESLNPLKEVKEISSTPILFLHGSNDRIVPVKNAHALYQAAQEPKWIKVYPQGGHSITDLGKAYGDTFRQDILRWLKSQT